MHACAYVIASMCGLVKLWVQCLQSMKGGIRCHGERGAGSCEPPGMDTGSAFQICKGNIYSPLPNPTKQNNKTH